MLNEIFGVADLTKAEMQTLIWLAGWEECTVKNVISAIRKVMRKQWECEYMALAPGRDNMRRM